MGPGIRNKTVRVCPDAGAFIVTDSRGSPKLTMDEGIGLFTPVEIERQQDS
jgi:hypothetical protein